MSGKMRRRYRLQFGHGTATFTFERYGAELTIHSNYNAKRDMIVCAPICMIKLITPENFIRENRRNRAAISENCNSNGGRFAFSTSCTASSLPDAPGAARILPASP